jgi:tetratricopeptide (TPR) repeat protein
MHLMKTVKTTLLLAALALNSVIAQQIKTPAASPLQTIKQEFALSDLTVEYSRPGVKDRVVFGDLVPYGKLWRTGANASTKITFGEDVKLNGNAVPAGKYALYTVPGKDEWEIVIHKNINHWGDGGDDYKQAEDLVRFKVKTAVLPYKVETFTINIADITNNTANIELIWDKTKVSFTVVSDIDGKIVKQIDEALSPKDKRPYFQAARYYYEADKDQKQALEWATKAIEQTPDAFWISHLKAKIQLKLKDYKGAITTAEASMAKAKEQKNNDYVALNEKLIAEAKKGK